MGSRYEVEVTVGSARDLKNVNWRNGDLQPYAVLWVDDGAKCSTRVDLDNGESPEWDEKLVVPLPPSAARLEDAVLRIDVVHAGAAEGTKPLVGSARLPLRDVLDDAGLGGRASRSLRLKRPSGRPQGRLDVRVAVREAARYYDPAYPPPYGQSARDPYAAQAPYGSGGGYGQQQQPYAAPPSGYPGAYGAAVPAQSAGYPSAYGAAPPAPAYGSVNDPAQKKKGMGMGRGWQWARRRGCWAGWCWRKGRATWRQYLSLVSSSSRRRRTREKRPAKPLNWKLRSSTVKKERTGRKIGNACQRAVILAHNGKCTTGGLA